MHDFSRFSTSSDMAHWKSNRKSSVITSPNIINDFPNVLLIIEMYRQTTGWSYNKSIQFWINRSKGYVTWKKIRIMTIGESLNYQVFWIYRKSKDVYKMLGNVILFFVTTSTSYQSWRSMTHTSIHLALGRHVLRLPSGFSLNSIVNLVNLVNLAIWLASICCL